MNFRPEIQPFFRFDDIRIDIQRSDLVDPEVSGNKWYKMMYMIDKVRSVGVNQILTFGGAFSNHILATAALGARNGIRTVGIIRGDEHSSDSNPTLRRAAELGMKLDFVTRENYLRRLDTDYHEELAQRHGYFYLIPEGGAHYLAVNGCMKMLDERVRNYDVIACSAGTGTMASGFAAALPAKQKLWVFPALKGGLFIRDEMKRLLMQLYWDDEVVEEKMSRVEVFDQYHFDGYGKVPENLVQWINEVKKMTAVPLDPIYTSKAAWGLKHELEKRNSESISALLIHSGGLQGIDGFNQMQERKGRLRIE